MAEQTPDARDMALTALDMIERRAAEVKKRQNKMVEVVTVLPENARRDIDDINHILQGVIAVRFYLDRIEKGQ